MNLEHAQTSKPVIPSPYLTPAEAAVYLKVSPRTLRRWTRSRVVPHMKIRRKLLYKVADLDAALAKFQIDSIGDV
jgi:excisionase family DNA binding protein